MAIATVSYSFVPGTLIKATEANQNFTDLLAFLNTNVIHKDGSVASTGTLSGPAADPVSDNQYARKAYVDKLGELKRQTLSTSNGPFASNATTDFALASVVVSDQRLYKVCLDTQWSLTAGGNWAINLHVDGVVTDRLGLAHAASGDANIFGDVNGAVLWTPTSGTKNLDVRVELVNGGASITFNGSGVVQRHFWVEDIGPR